MKLSWEVVTDQNTYVGESEINEETHITCAIHNETIQKVTGTIPFSIAQEDKIFMNGYQTWTVCPEYTTNDKIRGMHGIPKFLNNIYAFDRYGDYHFVNYPNKKGITHGFTYCYFRHHDEYRMFASLDENPGYTMFKYDYNETTLTIERDCAGIKYDGEYPIFDVFYKIGKENDVFDSWFNAIHIQPRTTQKIYGYSSWYNRYQDINEQCILEDLNGCDKVFSQGDLFQVDDGWEPFVGDWLEEDKTKFPNGMKSVVDTIHSKGYRAGLWLAPFVAEEKSSLYQNHQDWFLKVDGNNWKNGSNWSGFYSLDFDNPEVQQYLRDVFKRVKDEWGFDLVKLDFLYGVAPFGNEHETRSAKMKRAMRFLREVCGDMLILGCGVPVESAFGVVDYCRISCDVSLDWNDKLYMRAFHRERTSTKQAIQNIISRRQLNNRAYGSDPDVFFLRSENISLPDEDKNDLAILDALLGDVFLISDDPGKYTDEMVKKYKTYRKLTEATVLSVKGKSITFMIDGQKQKITLFRDRDI